MQRYSSIQRNDKKEVKQADHDIIHNTLYRTHFLHFIPSFLFPVPFYPQLKQTQLR